MFLTMAMDTRPRQRFFGSGGSPLRRSALRNQAGAGPRVRL